MEIRALCAAMVSGAVDLWGMARRGELGRAQLWVAAKGARRYVEAIARGDVAPAAEAAARRRECAGCEARVAGKGLVLGYCGEPFVVVTTPGRETCGCVLDGAVLVASHACPRKRFAACRPRPTLTPCTANGRAVGA